MFKSSLLKSKLIKLMNISRKKKHFYAPWNILKNYYYVKNLFSRLALDFRSFLENMRMSSSLSEILKILGMNVFKNNTRII